MLPSIRYTSIKQLLLSRLQVALGLYIPDLSVPLPQKSQISLHRAKDNCRVFYVCAIAFQLSQAKKISPREIASAIANLICQTSSSLPACECLDLRTQVVPPGWLHLEFTEPAIAGWLQSLVLKPPCLSRGAEGINFPALVTHHSPLTTHRLHLFAVQSAHARCCSLLQLAEREGLVTLKQLDSDSNFNFWSIAAPDPIPWLNSEQKLCWGCPAEGALVGQIADILDALYCYAAARPVNWEKAALNLSQAFQTFDRCCRIWGEVKVQAHQLAQVRLGLVAVTQVVLKLLLQDILRVHAPQEL